MEIKVDSEFKSLIPPLTDEEYDGLRDSILAEGCRDALVLWGDTLIDGHNRYEICEKHGIPFKTIQKDFDSRDDAKLWMMQNQLSRRNLIAYQRSVIALEMKTIIAKKAKAQQIRSNENRVLHNCAKQAIDTREELAKMAGVSHNTIAKVEKIEAMATPEMKEQLRSGQLSIDKAFNAVRLEAKKQEIRQAEKQIAEQATEDFKPILHIGNGIGFIPDEKYDLLLTDPPYMTDIEDMPAFVNEWLYNALDGVKDTGFAYIFIGAYPDEVKAYLNAEVPKHMHLEQILVWTYKNTLGQNPKDRYKQNYQNCLFYRGENAPDLDCPLTSEQWAVQEINAPDGRQGDRYHAWQKPMEIAERFIRHSTKSGDIVFDPFACTGTFLLASAKLGRKAYGFEINPDNAEIALGRGCLLA